MSNRSSILTNTLTAIGQNGFASFLAPITRAVEYAGNTVLPITVPGIDMFCDMYLKRHMAYSQFQAGMRIQGAFLPDTTSRNLMLFRWDGSQLLDDTRDDVENLNPWTAALRSKQYAPNPETVLAMLNRGIVKDDVANRLLRQGGVDLTTMCEALKMLRYDIPGPSDLIRFAVRESFSPAIVRQYGYAKETPKAVFPWMDKQGYGQELDQFRPDNATDDAGNALAGKAKWADLYWWSHWELPSVTQAMEMMYRLYPNSDYGPSPTIINNDTFTQDDFATLLKVQDYPDYWRKKMTAVSYQPLTRVDVRRMHAMGILNDGGVYHAYRQIGYDDANAKNLLAFTKEQNAAKPKKAKAILTQEKICEMYHMGLLDDDGVVAQLTKLGFRLQDIADFTNKCKLESALKEINIVMNTLKQAFINGKADRDTIKKQMGEYAVSEEWIEGKLDQWQLIRDYSKKELTTAKILDMYENVVITRKEAEERLGRLNYDDKTISLMIARTNQKVLVTYQRQLLANWRLRVKQTKAMMKAKVTELRNIVRDNKKILDDALNVNNFANLKLMLKHKLISGQDAVTRLVEARGYTEPDAILLVKSLIADTQGSNNVKAQKNQSNTVQPNPHTSNHQQGQGSPSRSGLRTGTVDTTTARVDTTP